MTKINGGHICIGSICTAEMNVFDKYSTRREVLINYADVSLTVYHFFFKYFINLFFSLFVIWLPRLARLIHAFFSMYEHNKERKPLSQADAGSKPFSQAQWPLLVQN